MKHTEKDVEQLTALVVLIGRRLTLIEMASVREEWENLCDRKGWVEYVPNLPASHQTETFSVEEMRQVESVLARVNSEEGKSDA